MSTILSSNITIDNEFEGLIPPLSEEEFAGLEKSLLNDGCRDRLVVWRGHNLLLDGHHRKKICGKHGIPFDVVEVNLPDRDAAHVWIVRNQFSRRNLSAYQRCELALRLEPLIAKQAKRNQIQAGRRNGKGCQNSDKAIEPIDTKKEVAKAANVSHDTLAKVKVIDAHADETAKAKLRAGTTTIHREFKRIVDAERKAEQIEAVQAATLPDGKYHVIVADPPWSYHNRPDDPTHRGRCPYPSMTVDAIKDLPVGELAHDDCILWLWVTNAHIVEGHTVAEAWGFTVKTILTWGKSTMGLGDWLRGQTEHCLMCVKGRPVVNLTNQTTLLCGAVREHSRKPKAFYRLVEVLCPGTKAELFAREDRGGWTAHGAETGLFSTEGASSCETSYLPPKHTMAYAILNRPKIDSQKPV
ncbi:MAG: MT-A70 family methyltransferase [Planctomycetota bacterium]